VQDNDIAFGNNDVVLVSRTCRQALDEIEKPFATGRYVRAVLDVLWRPKLLCCCIIAPVEKRLERLRTSALFSASLGLNIVRACMTSSKLGTARQKGSRF